MSENLGLDKKKLKQPSVGLYGHHLYTHTPDIHSSPMPFILIWQLELLFVAAQALSMCLNALAVFDLMNHSN